MIGQKINQQYTAREEKEIFKELNLVSATDVAAILGWRVQKVSEYATRGVLPDPVGYINSRPVWTKQQIDKYQATRGHE